ncbi:response regulator transcription factor [Nonomuraea sp. NPDC050680]|uniref:response regulator transcription factor n=1 Tax=Nonomuraea sp. NPDC050680 TaxID=3154630 RepID=UPI0033CBE595
MVQLLLVEDDASVRSALTRALSERGHVVTSAPTAAEGLRQAVEGRPDLVVLDLGLPDLDGSYVLRMLRAVTSVPVIVATARDSEQEMVRVLDAGADDYVVKPFSASQLNARISAVLRRSQGETSGEDAVRVGGLRMSVKAREASLEGRPLELSPKEFDLLHYLATRAGEVVSKRELLAEVWQIPFGGADKTIDVHIAWLRRKLGETATAPRYLRSIRGSGVKIVDPSR